MALAKIGGLGLVSDSQIFARYLGFPQPSVQGMIVVNEDNVDDLFPAVKVLVKIGRGAVPTLILRVKGIDERQMKGHGSKFERRKRKRLSRY